MAIRSILYLSTEKIVVWLVEIRERFTSLDRKLSTRKPPFIFETYLGNIQPKESAQ